MSEIIVTVSSKGVRKRATFKLPFASTIECLAKVLAEDKYGGGTLPGAFTIWKLAEHYSAAPLAARSQLVHKERYFVKVAEGGEGGEEGKGRGTEGFGESGEGGERVTIKVHYLKAGTTCHARGVMLEASALVEDLRRKLADERFFWRPRKNAAVPEAYIVYEDEEATEALASKAAIVGEKDYYVRIATRKEMTKRAAERKRIGAGRPKMGLPAWMSKGGAIETMDQFDEGEKLLARMRQSMGRAKKVGDAEEVERIATSRCLCHERMKSFREENADVFRSRARGASLELQGELDRFGLKMAREIDRLAKAAYGEKDEESAAKRARGVE